ncbi:uncharacterized protein LACBIDRAFT_323287 [Laccaria bicolor S238N-H82]|uniref:Predicted protein n=1 Tax=Laccaria bicolor (strain S238N-H82 / ATCC MYA-4686) TaxID=486041 RepID=B0CZQ7_LACBS|nr:uncharacterized protein LACBIDRAFT_323287 [Laccaria bicolor S238N-H82]EDR12659.1 predicted protein [Laccaria bicolor S238N-H82]|eukprot:XP_001876923.1 predicted protein [Laccaria bicolor S238N-H82]
MDLGSIFFLKPYYLDLPTYVILAYSQASYIQQPHLNASVQGWHLPRNVISFRTATFFCGGSIYSYYSVANVAGAWGGLQWRPKNRALNIVVLYETICLDYSTLPLNSKSMPMQDVNLLLVVDIQ